MMLVIAGHFPYWHEMQASLGCHVLWDWIYMFHMPLFIFISGHFSHKQDRNFIKSIWKLLEPLLVFQILMKVIRTGSFSIYDFLSPWWVLWYLLSLIFWRLLLQIIPDCILGKTRVILVSTFCISILAGFLPFESFLSIQRTLAFLPFFFLGYYMRGRNLFLPIKYKSLCYIILIISFLIPLLLSQYLGDLTHEKSYSAYYNAFSRILVFTLSIPMSLAFINICPNIKWIANQGRYTMQYYIYHALIANLFLGHIIIKLNIPVSLFTVLVWTLIIEIIIGIASYLPYFNKLTNPSLILKDVIKKKRMRIASHPHSATK